MLVAGHVLAFMAFGGSEAMASSLDGIWSVSIVTQKGECPSGMQYPVRVAGNVISNANDLGAQITGLVHAGGRVTVTVKSGDKEANGSGRLSGRAGTGRWSGSACSGTWSAART